MGNVSIYLHKSVLDSVDIVATILDTSRSETIEMMVKHVMENDLEGEIWEGYEDLESDFIEAMEEEEGSEEEEEEEEESED